MRLARKRTRGIDVESLRLPLVALIDVVFFLLFYFIIAGTLAVEEGQLATSIGTRAAASQTPTQNLPPQKLLVRWVNGVAVYRLGDRAMRDRAELREVLSQLPKDPGLLVGAEPSAPMEAIAGAVQLAKDAGFVKVSYQPLSR
jgi:biopolymer transport protein ExbD